MTQTFEALDGLAIRSLLISPRNKNSQHCRNVRVFVVPDLPPLRTRAQRDRLTCFLVCSLVYHPTSETNKASCLQDWLQCAEQSELPAFKGFARGLRRDYSAVSAALPSVWSQGQVEGQITRLKLLKRQMYGRAKFDLLRLQVLHAA